MSQKPLFKEVIRPPLWLIAFIYFMLFSLVLAIWAAFDNNAAINAFAIAIVIGLVAIYMATSTIIVAAYLATIFWISKGIKMQVADSRDRTPYWLISTKKATALKKAMEG